MALSGEHATWWRARWWIGRAATAPGLAPGLALGLGLVAAGCAQTTRVGDTVTPQQLARSGKAVAVMRVGAASPTCQHVAVRLAVPSGAGYRPVTWLKVYNVRSLDEPAVAEAALEPGTYHVVAYQCAAGKTVKGVGTQADPDTYATSYAHFALNAGEVVNVGYLRLQARRVGANAFGRPVQVSVSVTDWPLDELERYKARRPKIYAQMTTRLMSVTPAAGGASATGAAECATLAALKASGKIQVLPQRCAGRI